MSSSNFLAHLSSGSLSREPGKDGITGDTEHGTERQEPAENVTPERVVVVVSTNSQGLVFNQTEKENSLKWRVQ